MKACKQGPLTCACMKNKHGFTYLEMLAVVTIVALCFVPLLRMFAQSVDEVLQYSELGTAVQLGRDQMEHVRNLRMSEDQMMNRGEVWIPSEKEPPQIVNKIKWRIKREPVSGTNQIGR